MSVDWDVLAIGTVTVDDLVYIDAYPAPGTKLPVQALQRQGGGLAGTSLVAAARLGARAAYWGILGDDDLSRFTLHELAREGVDCGPVLRRDGARPIQAIVIVDQSTAQRTILFSREGVVKLRPEEISAEIIARCRVFFVDHSVEEGGLRAVEVAHSLGVPVVADIERESEPAVSELLPRIDHLIVGVDLAQRVTGESEPVAVVRALSAGGRACSVVTAGERGCWYLERGGEVRHQPAFRVQVVDTTGCGDVFHGVYAACLAWGQPVDSAVRMATAAAGIKATRPGGRSGIPDRATVERFLRS